MSGPSSRHVEAVAGYLHAVTCAFCDSDGFACGSPREGDGYDFTAHVLLTSIDPAVLDAMQDALARAGRLAEPSADVWLPPPPYCDECRDFTHVAEVSDETLGHEEQQREVVVTRLACGHEIVNERGSGRA